MGAPVLKVYRLDLAEYNHQFVSPSRNIGFSKQHINLSNQSLAIGKTTFCTLDWPNDLFLNFVQYLRSWRLIPILPYLLSKTIHLLFIQFNCKKIYYKSLFLLSTQYSLLAFLHCLSHPLIIICRRTQFTWPPIYFP